MIKRSKFLLCALASVGVMTSFNTINANAMTMSSNTTTKAKQTLSAYQVEDLLWDLPYSIRTTNIKSQLIDMLKVGYASYAYDTLSTDQKKRIDPCAVYNLNNAKSVARGIVCDEVKAIDLVCKIYKLQNEVGYCKSTERKTEPKIDKEKVKPKIKQIQEKMKGLEDIYNNLEYPIKDKVGKYMTELGVIECKVAEVALEDNK